MGTESGAREFQEERKVGSLEECRKGGIFTRMPVRLRPLCLVRHEGWGWTGLRACLVRKNRKKIDHSNFQFVEVLYFLDYIYPIIINTNFMI